MTDDLMTLEEMRQHEWVVSWSGGKDSTATILLMREHQIPIKEIVYVRMMYDKTLPATLPVMTDFVDKAIKIFKDWGFNVQRTAILKSTIRGLWRMLGMCGSKALKATQSSNG